MFFRTLLPFRPGARLAMLLLGMLLLDGCQLIGKKMMQGAIKRLDDPRVASAVDRLSSRAAGSALETALRDSVQARLREKLDSLGLVLDHRANAAAVRLRDSLLGEYTNRWVQGRLDAAGDVMSRRMAALLDDARGEKTRRLVADLRDELLGDNTVRRAGLFRDELLGDQTAALLDTLGQRTVRNLIARQIEPLGERLADKARETADGAMSQAEGIAWVVGGAALLFLAAAVVLFRRARLHKNTLRVLTHQIDRIPSRQTYDWLVGNIRRETSAQGLEPHLQALLKEEKLYQQPEWQETTDRKVLRLVTEALSQAPPDLPAGALLTGLYRKAEEAHLEEHLQRVFPHRETQPPPAVQPPVGINE